MHFLDEFLRVTHRLECPTSYLEWAAYTAIAAVMRDNIYISRGPFNRVYPNLYVLLVGDSGATRKGTPLRAASRLVKPVRNTKIIEGRASIQGILNELAEVVTYDNGRTVRGASAFLYSEEFAAFLVNDPQVTPILTDLYDYKEEHDIVLKSQQKVHLTSICITMLSATNAAFLQDMFTKRDLYGGLVGRTIFIIEEKARKKDSGLDDDTKDEELTKLTNHLHKLSRKKGEAKLTKDAKKLYEDWYMNTDFTLNESKTGYEHRIHTHVLKLSLILAACEEDFDLLIERDHVETAINKLSALTVNYKKLIAALNRSQYIPAQAVNEIMLVLIHKWIAGEPLVERGELMRQLFGKIDLDSLDKGIQMLEQSKLIEIYGTATTVKYKLSEKGQQMFMSKLVSGKPN